MLLQVAEQVRLQIEYYFSVDNLVKDVFLRSKMDDQGWITTSVRLHAIWHLCVCRIPVWQRVTASRLTSS